MSKLNHRNDCKHIAMFTIVCAAWLCVFYLESLRSELKQEFGARGSFFEFHIPHNLELDMSSVTTPWNPEPKQPVVEEKPTLSSTLVEGFGLDEVKASRFARWIEEASSISGVSTEHLSVLIATESSFRYRAESLAGAIGPAQVMPRVWGEFCDGNLTDPRNNIICGARVLAHYLDSCPGEDWACAFKKYNVGPTGYKRASSIPAMNRYIAKIRSNQDLLERIGS